MQVNRVSSIACKQRYSRSQPCRTVPELRDQPRRARHGVLLQSAKDPLLTLHVGETTVVVPFSPAAAAGLREKFGMLLKTFAEKQKAERPKRWDIMDYRYKGEQDGSGLASFEVCCNPNAYPSAFDAKLLITITTKDGIRVATEGRLSNFKSDFEEYLKAQKAREAAATP